MFAEMIDETEAMAEAVAAQLLVATPEELAEMEANDEELVEMEAWLLADDEADYEDEPDFEAEYDDYFIMSHESDFGDF